ncbi:MAG: hypothetical protein GEV03_08480 [Streptosporangiales bacterium]|nr:hypothetical protein [Streptosporangiales bacterium]
MNTTTIVIIVAAVVVAGGLAVMARRRRSARLQRQFGPEYEHTVSEAGDRRSDEARLREREKRHEELTLRPLPAESRARYQKEWNSVQERFVDTPGSAVHDADQLTTQIMREVGYPMDNFEQRAADISVEHPDIVEHYRAAHAVVVAHERGQAETEDLRRAVTSYRALVDSLLEDATSSQPNR